MSESSVKRILMTREVVAQWLLKQALPEYRFRVFNPKGKDYMSLLRSFRDGKTKIAGLDPIPDLGIREEFGGFQVWGSDASRMEKLKNFFEKRGMETTWIW